MRETHHTGGLKCFFWGTVGVVTVNGSTGSSVFVEKKEKPLTAALHAWLALCAHWLYVAALWTPVNHCPPAKACHLLSRLKPTQLLPSFVFRLCPGETGRAAPCITVQIQNINAETLLQYFAHLKGLPNFFEEIENCVLRLQGAGWLWRRRTKVWMFSCVRDISDDFIFIHQEIFYVRSIKVEMITFPGSNLHLNQGPPNFI